MDVKPEPTPQMPATQTAEMKPENMPAPKLEPKPEVKGEASGAAGKDDDDPVVQEFQVYNSNWLLSHLHLFQFPLRPHNRTYNIEKLKSFSMQVQNRRFQLEFDPKQQSAKTSYQSFFGGKTEDEETDDKRQNHVITSSRVVSKTNYAIGVVRGSMIHLTGLTDIHQFRPNLDKNMELNPNKKGRVVVDDVEAEEKDKGKKATFIPKHMQRRMRSHWQQNYDKDPWLEMPLLTADRAMMFDRLFSKATNLIPFNPRVTTSAFLHKLFPPVHEMWQRERHAKIPLSIAGDFDYRRQVESLMLSARVMKFSRLRELLVARPGSRLPSDGELLAMLEQCSVVIRGLLVVRQVPEFRGLNAVTREWVLYKLWQKVTVRRAALHDPPFNLPVEHSAMKAILEDVAELVPHEDQSKRVWRLKHGGRDEDFMQSHPQMCQQQDVAWDQRGAAIQTHVSDVKNASLTMEWQPRPTSLRAGTQTIGRMKQIEGVLSWLRKMFERYGVWNRAALTKRFREALRNSPTQISEDVFTEVVTKTTRKFHDAIILAKWGTAQVPNEIDKYRPAVVQAFRENRSLTKKEIEDKCGAIPPALYEKIVRELATNNGNTWTVKPGHM